MHLIERIVNKMISLNWVKDYIDLTGMDLKELAVKVTKAGINVEKVVTNKIDSIRHKVFSITLDKGQSYLYRTDEGTSRGRGSVKG